jgi:Ca2+-binding RTX toxin-like protein
MCIYCQERDVFKAESCEDFKILAASGISADGASSPPAAAGSYQQLANFLVSGYWQWSGYQGTGQRSWPDKFNITYNFDDLPSADRAMVELALQLWSEVGNVGFVRTSGAADIRFIDNFSGAYAAQTLSGTNLTSATVNVDPSWGGGTGAGTYSYRLQTYIHEIGHALGLGHQGPYNGSASYPADALYDNDSWQLSIMSYFSQTDNTSVTGSFALTLTPQIADIIAIQAIYGAPNSTRLGDTVYGVGTNTGRAVFGANFSDGAFPSVTIYDSGGNDTLNYSGTSQSQTINLNPGSFSSVYGDVNNIIIFPSTIIENAVGGSGNDTITGNGYSNALWGLGGNDGLYGGSANDTLIGGDGNDFLEGGSGYDTIYSGSGADNYYFQSDGHGGDFFPDWNYVNDQIQISQSGFAVSSVVFQNGKEVAAGASRTFLWDKVTGQFAFDLNGSNNGGKTVLATIMIDPTGTNVDNTWQIGGSGDFNNDGHSDIIWRSSSGSALIWEMVNGARTDGFGLGVIDNSWVFAAFGDFNGDGTDDIVWQNNQNKEVHFWQMGNHQKVNGIGLGEIDQSWRIVGSGDFNGDGTDDLLFRNSISNDGLVWTMNNGQKVEGYGLGGIDNTWQIAGAGDFDNDGTDDIAFRNTVSGNLLLWKMNNAEKSDGFGQGEVDLSWSIVATSDTDNDGHADIIWHNSQSGEVAKWGITSLTKTSGGVFAAAGTQWDVVGTGDFNNNNIADLIWRKSDGTVVTTAYNAWNQADLFASDITLV